MHRIDTPTAQADKFGPGKNGFTNGDPATGRRATDLNSDMWDAVQEEICAVVEKSGTALNKDQHDQLYQAIVKIITSKIPDALLKKNNLSDLADKALARANLQLKAAATRDVTTSTYDTTADRVLKVGDYGQGTVNGLAFLNSIFDITCAAKYSALGVGAGESATQGMPANSGNTRFSVEVDSIYTNQFWVTLRSSNQCYVGMINTSAKTATWSQLYSTAFKPTAGDVGALPITGGTLTGLLTLSNAVPYIALRATGTDTRRYIMGFNNDGSSSFYVGKANSNSESCMLWNYTPGSGVEITADGKINVNSKGRISVFNTDGTFTPAAWTTFDARYQAKGNYTPAGQAYTKAESNARFLQGWRLGAQGNVTNNNGGAAFANAPNGAVVTGIAQKTDWTSANYRYAQYNLNGTWYNAGVV